MDLPNLLSCLAGFIFFVLLYIRIINPNNKNRNLLLPPVAAGALPIIGHIPILNSQNQILSRTLGDMADKHGPLFIVRSGMTPIAMICGLEAAKDCFTTHERDVASKPEFAVGEHLGYNYAMFSFSSDNAYWRVMRKFVVSELLSNVKLDKVKHIRMSELETSIKELYLFVTASPEPNKAAVVRMDEWLAQLTLNTSCRIVAGRRYKFKVGGAVGDEDSSEYKEAQDIIKVFREFQYLSGLFVLQDAFPLRLFKWFDFQGHVRAMKRNNKKVDKILQGWIDQHIERRQVGNAPAAGDDQDLIDLMLSTIDKEFVKGLPHTHQMAIKGTTQSMIIDGSDTTGTHMTWVLAVLVKYGDVMKRCREEIEAQVGKDRWVEDSDVKKLQYLQAVVKESLRLYPSVPLLTPRMTSKDCKIGGYDLPKGTQFNVNLWKIMRDPKFWPEPDKFMPERFLNRETTEADNPLKRFEYVPFGCGRRICVGMTYALQISHLTIARLIQGFDFSTPGNVELDMEEGLGVTLPRATPLQLVVTPRLPPNFYGV
nr:cytochrome P450 82C4-like [Ipomoea batatas]